MLSNLSEKNLTYRIIMAMICGMVLGLTLNYIKSPEVEYYVVNNGLDILAKIFISSLKMLVVPLVFCSLVCGVANLENINKLGTLGFKTFLLYVSTTIIALSLAIIISLILKPGVGFNLPTDVIFVSQDAPSFSEVIINIFPSNPFKSAAEGNMLQIIFFALLFGVGLSQSCSKTRELINIFEQLNTTIMNIINLLMKFAPLGVFALLAKVFSSQGSEAIIPLLNYFILVSFVLVLHAFITFSFLLKFAANLSPIIFLRKFRSVIIFGFSTASSNATLPITMKAVTQKMGVKQSIAGFTLPLGATINMDGTAIMQGVATVFISQAYNIDISLFGFLQVVLTATLASIGTAGVPGVGLITLALVLKQVGLPVEGIGLIIGVDRLLDMIRTSVNICGDAVVSCVVAKWEDQIDSLVYEKSGI
ncbi:MAG: dicarboxylate/amino acid:cation symporter [Zetaproteobacteria bacterium]|nr:dicarboxylate/amino acid:cation symporter [Pseudobdellovibrionaceae bacterium]